MSTALNRTVSCEAVILQRLFILGKGTVTDIAAPFNVRLSGYYIAAAKAEEKGFVKKLNARSDGGCCGRVFLALTSAGCAAAKATARDVVAFFGEGR